MMGEDMNTVTARIIAGFLLGTLIGVATGLLLAPESGKKTRRNISDKTRQLAKQMADYIIPGSAAKNGKASVGVES